MRKSIAPNTYSLIAFSLRLSMVNDKTEHRCSNLAWPACTESNEMCSGLRDVLTFTFRSLALRKPKDYYERTPCHDMPPRMLEHVVEPLSEIRDASIMKVAVYFGKYDYEVHRKLHPDSEPTQLFSA